VRFIFISCFYTASIGYSKENLKIHTGVPSLPSLPSLPYPPLHCLPLPLPFPAFLYPLPFNPAGGSGELCKLPQRGLGGAPAEIDFGAF